MLNKFRNHFISGLLVLGPLFLTVLFLGYLIRLTDRFVVNPLFRILPLNLDASAKIFLTKIAIAAIVVIAVILVGIAAERFIFKKFILFWENFLKNIPIFNTVYSAFKEIAQAFFGDKKGIFKRVVFVQYPRQGVYAMAFVTQDKPWEIGRVAGKEMINVFVPAPPNPATGFFISVPKEDVVDSRMTVEEGIRLVVSAGAAIPSQPAVH